MKLYPATLGPHRIHHGAVGVGLVVLGLVCVLHDWIDRRVWWRDLRRWP